MKPRIVSPSLLPLFLLGAAPAFAQMQYDPIPGGLWEWVNASETVTPLQWTTARSVEPMCVTLAGLDVETTQLTPQASDLSLRCTELVHTALELTDTAPDLGRDLNISGDELLAALQQVSGEEMLAQGTMSTRVTNGQFANIAGRLNALRLGNAGAAIGGRVAYADPTAEDRADPGYTRVSVDRNSISGGAAAADIGGSRWGWFLEGSYNTGDRNQTVAEDGFDFDAASFTLGVDYLFDSGVFGFSIGSDDYSADFVSSTVVSGGDMEVEGTTGSIFGAFTKGKVFVNAIASFGNLDINSTRRAIYPSNNTCTPACPGENDRLLGNTDGDFLSGGATVGADFNTGNWDLSPSLSLTSRDIDIDGYNEVDPAGGGLALAYADQNIKSFRSILSLAVTGTFSKDFGVVSPYFRVEWHHEYEDDPLLLTAKYAAEESLAGVVPNAAGPGVFSQNFAECISCFVLNSDDIDTDFGVVAIGVSAVFARRLQFYAVYEALTGISDLSSDSVSLGVRRQF